MPVHHMTGIRSGNEGLLTVRYILQGKPEENAIVKCEVTEQPPNRAYTQIIDQISYGPTGKGRKTLHFGPPLNYRVLPQGPPTFRSKEGHSYPNPDYDPGWDVNNWEPLLRDEVSRALQTEDEQDNILWGVDEDQIIEIDPCAVFFNADPTIWTKTFATPKNERYTLWRGCRFTCVEIDCTERKHPVYRVMIPSR